MDRDQSVCVLRDFSCRFSRDDYGDARPKVWCVEFYDVDVLILYPDLNQESERGRGGEANPCFVLGLPSCEGLVRRKVRGEEEGDLTVCVRARRRLRPYS